MSTLEKYGISYQKMNIDGDEILFCNQEIVSDISYCISGYLDVMGACKDFYEQELLVEIDKAIEGQSFNSDAGGDGVYLTINYPESTFESGRNRKY